MTIPLYPEFFNDVFGPIMQPGSSSHTAAPCRLGYLAHSLLGERPREIRVLLDRDGSFAGTFGLMYEDQAMLAGAMGMLPDDPRLFQAAEIARAEGITFSFEFTEMRESTHINAMKFVLTGESGRVVTLVGDSTGGGMVETKVVNGFPLRVKGDSYVVLIFDGQNALTAGDVEQLAAGLTGVIDVGSAPPPPPILGGQAAPRPPSEILESEAAPPAVGGLGGPGRGTLHFIRTADAPNLTDEVEVKVEAEKPSTLASTSALTSTLTSTLTSSSLLRPVLPVITRPERKPQLFRSMTEWREIAAARRLPLWEVTVQYEMDASGWSRDQVLAAMRHIAAKMHRQTHAAYEAGAVVPESPFKTNLAALWEAHRTSPRRLTDDVTANTLKWAFGAGAGIPGVETVPGPMGSGGGYIYAALYAIQEAKGFSDDDLLRGLFIAAGIGAIAYTRTEPTGEVIGCSGECGICGAMAAAALAEMAGGTPEQVENAASLALQAATGWPCDPIPGGLGQPCRSRILAATCTAVVFADLALAGRDAVLPLHEAIDVADAVGRRLPPELLCTSRGGACVAPSAIERGAAYRVWFDQTAREGIQRPPGNLI